MMRNALSSGDMQRLAADAREGGAAGVGGLRAGRANTCRTFKEEVSQGNVVAGGVRGKGPR
eukprot:6938916-Pyramimonas_sp.AAC.1